MEGATERRSDRRGIRGHRKRDAEKDAAFVPRGQAQRRAAWRTACPLLPRDTAVMAGAMAATLGPEATNSEDAKTKEGGEGR